MIYQDFLSTIRFLIRAATALRSLYDAFHLLVSSESDIITEEFVCFTRVFCILYVGRDTTPYAALLLSYEQSKLTTIINDGHLDLIYQFPIFLLLIVFHHSLH